MILSLDTTTEFGSLALTGPAGLVEEALLRGSQGFGLVLFDEIAALLKRHGMSVGDVDCFAAASGPGSFTGVRVGLTAVKGLAEATGKPVVAVSNLQAMAVFGTAALRATVLDARRGDVYAAVYRADLEIVVPEAVVKLEPWLAGLPAAVEVIEAGTPPRALAGALGRIAWARWQAGLGTDPAAVDANYVRRADAEMMWKDRAVSDSCHGPSGTK